MFNIRVTENSDRRRADTDTSDYIEVASYTYPADAVHAAMTAALPPLGQ